MNNANKPTTIGEWMSQVYVNGEYVKQVLSPFEIAAKKAAANNYYRATLKAVR